MALLLFWTLLHHGRQSCVPTLPSPPLPLPLFLPLSSPLLSSPLLSSLSSIGIKTTKMIKLKLNMGYVDIVIVIVLSINSESAILN